MICNRMGSSEGGFTLIELLVAIAIMGIGIVPMVHGYVHSMRAIQEAKNVSIANMLARHKLETIKGKNTYSSLPTSGSGTFPAPYEHFEWEITGSEVPGFADNFNVKQVKIRVKFESMYGDKRSINCTPVNNCSTWDFNSYVAKRK
ncbi:MAG: prepilin-type N-terminal cleavage/methylation domain-containing protein [bacterium]